ncbi:MAG: ABC transporter ATP-binding protein [Candidatus Terrybacteria bacterium RIFCSPLOWO2_01_FULL_58_14]|uniref:ABC transporter ATP-binding protein n=2 Tax=Candidatus Terryibacteriota TaxID=1817920 RepID=A0A1G2Q193_9BACT|nr:MAG: ABC transporter ATP-binding protein [Candidatus Terrybacteria bacterium RIFCSPHIGHO2_01_FULL_58_15]OHA53789.1 MAG: ABC transporter ATP-binding protein [Candidatus Terrybacteria bacterium RIFCSPLOWO2_01_FULL_58_14]
MSRQQNPQAIRLATQHYLNQLKKDWRLSLPGMLLPGIGTILVAYTPPLIVATILTRFGRGQVPTLNELIPYLALIAGIWLFGEVIWRIAMHFILLVEGRGMNHLYVQAMDELLKKDLAFFHNNFAGSLTKKTVAYAKHYEGFIDTLVFNVVSSVPPLFFVAIVLWRYSFLLVFTLVGLMALTLLIVLPLIRRRQALVEVRESASNIVAGHVADTLSNIDAVRAFAREPFEAKTHTAKVDDYVAKAYASWNYQNRRIDVVTSPFYVLTNVAGLLIAIATGGSLPAVFLTFSYYSSFTRVMWEFNRIYRNLENHITEAAQFTELLLDPPAITDPENPKPFTFTKGDIEFRDVRFRYHATEGERLFDHFSLRIRDGEKVGLVGRSGGGKTTVTKLLLRLMDVEGGEILISGQNITEITQADLRSVIAYVPQDPFMFHRSIMENIRYGRLEASDEEIFEAARFAHAASFIEKLPQKYETRIGERGVKLSGGQRQRVALARAVVRNAPILVLDEATSALDSESEKLIQDALWRLMKNRTAIVIAHRLSTVQKMDRIIVLEEGKITGEGSHAELLARGGHYADLWAHQTGAFLQDDGDEDDQEEGPELEPEEPIRKDIARRNEKTAAR